MLYVASSLLILSLGVAEATEGWVPKSIRGMDYPRLAVLSKTQGIVELKCSIRSDGGVSEAHVVTGPALLAEAAQKNALKWTFRRVNEDRQPLPSVGIARIKYIFRLEGVTTDKVTSDFAFEYPDTVVVTSQAAHWMAGKPRAR
jgi:hypothetical protein